ncbi:MAG TPA: GrpB family protein [Candidatus Baltobacteraceae bacterium]
MDSSQRFTIRVVDYDPRWTAVFSQLRERLRPAVGDFAAGVEHVGGTAVRGLAAKPIIDIDVIVKKDDVARAIDAVEAIGYKHLGDLGIPGREAFTAPEGLPPHHLYVCVKGGTAVRNHLALREYLRTHSDTVEAYGALKRDLAMRFPDDIDAYGSGKTTFIASILEAAAFGRDELDAIREQNMPR